MNQLVKSDPKYRFIKVPPPANPSDIPKTNYLKSKLLFTKNLFRVNCTRKVVKRKMLNVFAKMAKMVTQHGKNLAAGLSKTQDGRYLMSKVFNVKQEQISLQLPRQL